MNLEKASETITIGEDFKKREVVLEFSPSQIVNYSYPAKSKYLNKNGEVCEYAYTRKTRYIKKERSDEKVKRNFIRNKLKTLTEEQINQIYEICK